MLRFVAALVLLTTPAFAATTHTFQVGSNTPQWQTTHSYTHIGHLGDRVLVGPALSVGTTVVYNGSNPLYLLELTTAGTSGGSLPTVSSCPSTGITDGSAVWKCLVVLDYVSFNAAQGDDITVWAPGGSYYPQQFVRNAGYSWINQSVFDRTTTSCTAGAGPGPTNPAIENDEGTCRWFAVALVEYTTGHAFPHMLNPGGNTPTVQEDLDDHVYNIWHGGFGITPEGGMFVALHQMWYHDDTQPYCSDGVNIWPDHCTGGFGGKMTIQAAPGEGYCNNPASTTPLAYDSSKGVAFENLAGTGIQMADAFETLNCIQVKNRIVSGNTDSAITGFIFHNNNLIISNNIIDSDGVAALAIDANNFVSNNLIIHRSTVAGSMALQTKYWENVWNNTIIHVGGPTTDSVAVYQYCLNFPNPGESLFIDNNIIIGFQYAVAIGSAAGCSTFPYVGTSTVHNVTDQANGSSGTAFTDAWGGSASLGYPMVNSNNVFSQTLSALVVDPATDFNLKAGSAAIGAGVADSIPPYEPRHINTTDFFGTTRVTFDVGMVQFDGAGPAAIGVGHLRQ